MKKVLSCLLTLALLIGVVACTAPAEQPAPDATPAPQPVEQTPSLYTPGSYSATAPGFGGEVRVEITVDANAITACVATGAQETAGIGSNAIEQLPGRILEANSADVDMVSGATISSTALLQAAEAALRQAKGEGAAAVQMAAGTYSGSGSGYDWVKPVVVDVTVSETEILSIEVTDIGRETPPIFRSAQDLMIPRIIENQSLAVDAITGATASSNGIRAAVSNALVQALGDASALAAFQTAPEKSTAQESISVDVLVVGMGGSGCSAALSAAESMHAADPAAVSVLAIDKSGKFGGTSANCGEPMAVNPTRYKKDFNEGKDYTDGDAMLAAWDAYTLGDAKMDIVEKFLDNSGDTIDWLFYDHGFTFNNALKGFTAEDIYYCKYQYTYRGNMEEGRDYGREFVYRPDQVDEYFHTMMQHYTELGGKYMLETEAYELLYDAAGNTVTGVKARGADGTEYTINAKAVVLATGGFVGNTDMQKQYLGDEYYPLKGAWGTYGYGMSQNDGKMVQAALNIGAGTYSIDMPPMVHFVTTPQILREYPVNEIEGKVDARYGYPATWSLNDVPMTMAISQNVLQVTPQGERYGNEAATFVWWQAGPTFFSVWSDAQVKQVQEKGFSVVKTTMAQGQGGVPVDQPVPEIYDVLESAIAQGYVYKADTLADLAAATGMDAAKLEQSVATYNEMCANGEDTQFGKDPKYLWALGESGPYYAVTGASVAYSTCGALDIDEDFRVLQADGATPIAGLYAVGTDSMGVLYTNKKPYVTFGGAALGWAFTSGRLAGQIVTTYAAQ